MCNDLRARCDTSSFTLSWLVGIFFHRTTNAACFTVKGTFPLKTTHSTTRLLSFTANTTHDLPMVFTHTNFWCWFGKILLLLGLGAFCHYRHFLRKYSCHKEPLKLEEKVEGWRHLNHFSVWWFATAVAGNLLKLGQRVGCGVPVNRPTTGETILSTDPLQVRQSYQQTHYRCDNPVNRATTGVTCLSTDLLQVWHSCQQTHYRCDAC